MIVDDDESSDPVLQFLVFLQGDLFNGGSCLAVLAYVNIGEMSLVKKEKKLIYR